MNLPNALVIFLLSGTCALAQEASDPPPPPTVPDLDDLLGLEEEGEQEAQEKGAEPDEPDELDRMLSGEELSEAFAETVRMMETAADKLQDAADPGLDTQRLQERIIKRLEQLIAQAPQQRQSSSSSSSSSQSQSGSMQPQPATGQSQPAGAAGAQAQGGSPPLQEGPLAPAPGLGSALWGALPQRVRDSISQGASDHFSTLYQELTEAYYRRLAEEADE